MRPSGHVYDIYILGVRRMMRSKRLKMAWFRSSPVATVLAPTRRITEGISESPEPQCDLVRSRVASQGAKMCLMLAR